MDAVTGDPVEMEPVDDYITDVGLDGRGMGFNEMTTCALRDCRVLAELQAQLQSQPQSQPPVSPPSRELGRSSSPDIIRRGGGTAAKERDGNACIFSGTNDPAAAHIFPFATSANRQFNGLESLLTLFWGADRAASWARNYRRSGIMQSPKNILSLNHQLHFWFDKAKFALKPLRQTPNEIVVQWHWLRQSSLKPRAVIKADEDLLAQAGLVDYRSWGVKLAHRKSGLAIRTGQTFTIRAEDPESLPSFELLEMQWNLHGVALSVGLQRRRMRITKYPLISMTLGT
ncbi:uncharacterized protein B0T15DRAFT_514262 [Chaetomium strumarium]|uniref:HNH nuclease domain-containing protein n=1 Tax=Chaetomium strumarium TaxID=1170767 RepID=A0AAJ0LYD1_9PEZI|nr:hypothetical protein B0T15DRAFT_514262 [Chaetomium strumarium]